MARKRTPRIIGVRKKTKRTPPTTERVYSPPKKSEKEKIYDVIYAACVRGYHFADSYYGMPLIELDDIEEKGEGLYVIRFRCAPKYLQDFYFGNMSKDVCKALRSEVHFIHEFKREWGLPYEECVWVLQVGEIQESIPLWRLIFMPRTKDQKEETKPSPKKCTHERWEEFLQSHYNRSLLSVAKQLGYSKQNLDLLGCAKNDMMGKRTLYSRYKKLFDSFLKDEWNKSLVDGRNVLDYFKDLIASWVGEDLLVRALNEYGFTASLANADKDRIIKTERREVTGEPDIKIEFEGNTRYLELMDALSPVEKYGQFDLRLSKAKNQYNNKSLFLLHGLADGKFILIDFMRSNVTVTYNFPNPRFGNKPCSVVRFEDNDIKMQEVSLLWETLRDIMLNTNPEPVHYLKMIDFESGNVEMLGGDESESDSDESSEYSETDSVPPEEDESSEGEIPEETYPLPEEITTVEEKEEELPSPPDIPEDNENDIPSDAETEENPPIEYTAEQWAALNEGI